ncbi:MAG: imidazole glycerol phosphate synthase subunit HisH [Proteobacteria bacterium]|nr:MAG: imidazole glycerol phosphate synthase subunit HisH [Pseudomonadota bacterium]
MQCIAVVDFGTGNLRSVSKALEHVADDARVLVTREPHQIDLADRVVLPGQGAMGTWLDAMQERGLGVSVRRALERVPVLGICLGMQALLEHSDEDGGTEGLGLIKGEVRRFERPAMAERDFKIPHMGWNRVRQARPHPLWDGIEDGTRFYFVHSYYSDPENRDDVAGVTDYIIEFTSAIARDNVFAVQFHPEKSHAQGLKLLANFVCWSGAPEL